MKQSKPSKYDNNDIVNYLNGHMNSDERRLFEQAVEASAQLRAELERERKLKQALVNSATTSEAQPQFDQIANRLESRRPSLFSLQALGWHNLTWQRPAAYAMSIALLAVTLSFIYNDSDSDSQDARYVTLTDNATQPDGKVLRITGQDSATLDQLIEQYQLTVSEYYPAALTIEVTTSAEISLDELADTLAKDERLKLVKLVDPK